MVTVDTNPLGPQLKLESLTHIDLSKLTQSELHSLSLCSSATFDLHDTSNLVIPTIDPSLFNESSGSRRQTFSHRHRHHHRSSTTTDPTHHSENTSIVNFLKHLINRNGNSDNCNKQIVVYRDDDQVLKGKRKRIGEHKKVVEIDERIEFKVVNGNGEKVDFVVLEEHADDLYDAELTRRTAPVESEELGLVFFRGLEGQWCSRRKKRRIVDAGVFGDWLPVGWKLVLALRRRDGVFSVYCRTFMRWSSYLIAFSLKLMLFFTSCILWKCGDWYLIVICVVYGIVEKIEFLVIIQLEGMLMVQERPVSGFMICNIFYGMVL